MTQRADRGKPLRREDVDAVMAGTRAMGALIAESLASVDSVVTMPQLRVLILASVRPLNVSAVADDLRVHPSNATRTCDRLVRAGLLDRRPDQADRRHVLITVTPEGRRLVDRVMAHRRSLVEEVLLRMTAEERAALARSLQAFTAAVGQEHLGLDAVVVQP